VLELGETDGGGPAADAVTRGYATEAWIECRAGNTLRPSGEGEAEIGPG